MLYASGPAVSCHCPARQPVWWLEILGSTARTLGATSPASAQDPRCPRCVHCHQSLQRRSSGGDERETAAMRAGEPIAVAIRAGRLGRTSCGWEDGLLGRVQVRWLALVCHLKRSIRPADDTQTLRLDTPGDPGAFRW